jgi:hypothetical protein
MTLLIKVIFSLSVMCLTLPHVVWSLPQYTVLTGRRFLLLFALFQARNFYTPILRGTVHINAIYVSNLMELATVLV